VIGDEDEEVEGGPGGTLRLSEEQDTDMEVRRAAEMIMRCVD